MPSEPPFEKGFKRVKLYHGRSGLTFLDERQACRCECALLGIDYDREGVGEPCAAGESYPPRYFCREASVER